MKFFILILFFSLDMNAATLSGEWKFEEMIYRDQRVQRLDPALNLRWTFFSNGTERLYWDRGTSVFCERFSYFQVIEDQLHTQTFALNPRNDSSCHNDPDMKLDSNTETKIKMNNDEIWLYLNLSDETLIYILKKVKGE